MKSSALFIFTIIFFLTTSHLSFAENEVRLMLSATSPEVYSHFSLSTSIISPNILKPPVDQSQNAVSPKLLASTGPRYTWLGKQDSWFQKAYIGLHLGSFMTQERANFLVNVDDAVQTDYFHFQSVFETSKDLYYKVGFSLEYPVELTKKVFVKFGANYDGMYYIETPHILRFGPCSTLQFGPFVTSLAFGSFRIEDPRLYLAYNLQF